MKLKDLILASKRNCYGKVWVAEWCGDVCADCKGPIVPGEAVRYRYEPHEPAPIRYIEHACHSDHIRDTFGVVRKVSARGSRGKEPRYKPGLQCPVMGCGRILVHGDRIRVFDDGRIECAEHVENRVRG